MALTPQDPHKAVITSVGSAIGGGTANSTKPVITGTADAGTTVDIFDGVRMIGTAIANANGIWSFTPTADLKAGSHSFTAISVDSNGDMGASSTPMSVTVPSGTPVGPVKPVIDGGGPTDDTGHPLSNPTNDPRPEMSGTGTPGDIITMYDGNTPIGSTVIDDTGHWHVKPEKDLDSGSHDIYVIETNPAGVPSQPSDHYPVVIDTSVPATPAAPTMTDDNGAAIPAGSTTADAHPHINGTGVAGDIIKVYDNGTVIGSTTVGGDGKWSFTPATDLSNGTHSITVVDVNAAGTPSAASGAISVVIATGTPATPAAPSLTDDNNNAIPAGSTTYDAHPHINGTGVAGDIIKVYDGSTLLGSVKVAGNGTWSFTPSTDLSTGSHSVNVTETNAAGTSSAHSASTSFLVNPSLAIPVITSIVDSVGPIQGNIAQGGVTDDARPVLHGTGVPGDVVTVGDSGNNVLGSAVVNASGQWTYQPATNLSNGVHSVVAMGKLASGWSTVWNFTVDTTTPATPATPFLTDDNGATIPAGSTTNDGHPHINGTGKAGDIITVYDGSTVLGSTTIGSNGQWTFTPSSDLSKGSHSINVTETNAAGTSSAHSGSIGFTYANVATPPAITNMVDAVGPIQGTIPNYGATDDSHPTVSGTGTAGSTVYIYQNGSGCGSAIVDGTGHWSVKIPGALSDGVHAMTATQFASGQSQSASSNTWIITVDTSTPATPAAPTMTNDSGANIPAGSTTNDGHPHINGAGVPGDVIKVYDNGTVIGSTTVAGNGTWTFTPSTDLSNGTHSITVVDVNAAGTPSATSPAAGVTINTGTPATPATPSLTDDNNAAIPAGSTTADGHPHINGTGTAGDIITVYDGSTVLGSTTIDVNGRWTFTPSSNLSIGTHSINVTEKNAAGTSSAHSGSIAFTYSNVAVPPVITGVVDAVGPVQGNVPQGGTTDDPNLTISGTGIPGDTVYVYLTNSVMYSGQPYGAGTTYVDASGHWSVKLNNSMPEGLNTISATQFASGAAQSAQSAGWVVTLNTSVPATPAAPTLTDDSGASIPAGSTTTDGHPHINGTGVAGDVITVYDNGTVIGSTTVGGDGQWTFTPLSDLSKGLHSISVTETNLAGTSSAHSNSTSFSYSTMAPPVAPVITGLTDVVGPYAGNVPNGGISSDGRPTLTGTGIAGDTINIYDNGVQIGSTTVLSNGTWAYQPPTALSNSTHSMTASQVNAGGTSAQTAPYSFVVDTTTYAGAQIVITGVYDSHGNLLQNGATVSGAVTVKGWMANPGPNSHAMLYITNGTNVGAETNVLPTIVGNTFSLVVNAGTMISGASGALSPDRRRLTQATWMPMECSSTRLPRPSTGRLLIRTGAPCMVPKFLGQRKAMRRR